MKNHEQENVTNEFVCVDPEVGEHYLYAYLAETLSETQKQEFEDHLIFCRKCQEDLEYMHWAVQQLKSYHTQIATTGEECSQSKSPQDASFSQDNSEIFFQSYLDVPLPVTSVTDGNAQNLIHDYHEKPLIDQLAASAETTVEMRQFQLQIKQQEK